LIVAMSPQSDEAFLREVDDGLRRDQAVALWRKWGIAAIVAVVVALAAFGGYLWWQSHQQDVAGEHSIAYNKALDELGANRPAQAAVILDKLSKESGQGYASLSRFVLADIALQKQDVKTAAKRFAEVAADEKIAQPLRDLALVRQTTAEYDSLQPQVVVDRLRALAVKGNPYFGSAGEMTAVAYVRLGRRDLAGRMFADISADEGVPQSIRQRAVQQAGVLGIDAVDQSKDK
jgi:hypothetical protein